MLNRNTLEKFTRLLGALFLFAILAGPLANAAENPFNTNNLDRDGYQVSEAEGKCGEGKCGEGMSGGDTSDEEADEDTGTEAKCGEGKCGEGKCGG